MPDSSRLQSLRRARGRKLEARDATAEERPKWRSVLVHPVFVGVIAALLGLISGVVSSRVNADLQLKQYWREQRFGVYSEYIDAYAALYSTVEPIVLGIARPEDYAPVPLTVDKANEIDQAWQALNEKKKKFDLVASYSVHNLADSGYSAHEGMIDVLKSNCRVAGLSMPPGCRKAVDDQVELSSYFDYYYPPELMLEAQKDLGADR